ncbi:MAG: hypothetical protein INQ03_25115 [Candidatus Heimdallarchaeota archaeon]|nr:hypothetical protein [Candidatus Heimdallarchaeota archaeon]
MATIKATISDELDEIFREKVLEKFGFRRGAITDAIVEAILQWVDQEIEVPIKKQELISHEKFTDKSYIALLNEEIVVEADSLEELWDNLPVNTSDKYTLITPRIKENIGKGQLGWNLTRK